MHINGQMANKAGRCGNPIGITWGPLLRLSVLPGHSWVVAVAIRRAYLRVQHQISRLAWPHHSGCVLGAQRMLHSVLGIHQQD